jgi:hypothetical protein
MAKSLLDGLYDGGNKPKKSKKGGLLSHLPGKKSFASTLGATFNVLDKPGQAIRTGLRTIGEDSYKGKSSIHAVLHGVEKAGEGLIGKDHTSSTELVSSTLTGRRDQIKKLPFGVETAVGIASDPTTYVSFGVGDKAKAALQAVEDTAGKDVAERVAKEGARKVLTADTKALTRQHIIKNLTDAGVDATKAAKKADKQLSALSRGGRGGLKVAGFSVPGLGNESAIGQAAIKASPKAAVGRALESTEGGRAFKGLFIRGAKHAVGEDASQALLHTVGEASDKTALVHAASDATWKNLYAAAKDAGQASDEHLAEMAAALDHSPATAEARKNVAQMFKDARKAEREAVRAEGHHQAVSEFAHTTLSEKRDALNAAKDTYQREAANYGSYGFDPANVKTAAKAVQKAQTDLERTAEKLSTSSTRQGVEQMAGHARINADNLMAAAHEAKANIPQNTKEAIARMRARGDNAMADIVEFADKERHRITSEQMRTGLLTHAHNTDEYLPRYLTKEGRKAIDKISEHLASADSSGRSVPLSSLKRSLTQGEVNMRSLFPNKSIAEVNKIAVEKGWVKEGERLFEDNPLAALAHRTREADAAVIHADMVEKAAQIKDAAGNPVLREAPKGERLAAGEDVLNLTETTGKQYVGHPDVVKLLNEANAVTTNDEHWRAFKKFTDSNARTWRSMATFGPAFHARNEAGNVWLNYLAGVRNPAVYLRAAKIQKAAHVAFKALDGNTDIEAAIAKAALSDSDKALLKGALDQGVLTHGFFHEDLVTAPTHLGGPKEGNKVTRGLLKANEVNKGAGSAVENNARLAHFIAKTEELGSQQEAAESVKKFLFDYGDLTPAEKHLKKFIPFYTFMRKNAPLELEQMFANPGKFTKYHAPLGGPQGSRRHPPAGHPRLLAGGHAAPDHGLQRPRQPDGERIPASVPGARPVVGAVQQVGRRGRHGLVGVQRLSQPDDGRHDPERPPQPVPGLREGGQRHGPVPAPDSQGGGWPHQERAPHAHGPGAPRVQRPGRPHRRCSVQAQASGDRDGQARRHQEPALERKRPPPKRGPLCLRVILRSLRLGALGQFLTDRGDEVRQDLDLVGRDDLAADDDADAHDDGAVQRDRAARVQGVEPPQRRRGDQDGVAVDAVGNLGQDLLHRFSFGVGVQRDPLWSGYFLLRNSERATPSYFRQR